MECLQHDAEKFFEVSIRHHENIVAFPKMSFKNVRYGSQKTVSKHLKTWKIHFLRVVHLQWLAKVLKSTSLCTSFKKNFTIQLPLQQDFEPHYRRNANRAGIEESKHDFFLQTAGHLFCGREAIFKLRGIATPCTNLHNTFQPKTEPNTKTFVTFRSSQHCNNGNLNHFIKEYIS